MDYRDELRLFAHQPLLQHRDSLPQPRSITPIFRDTTPARGQALAHAGSPGGPGDCSG
jgi:hypothetical protein